MRFNRGREKVGDREWGRWETGGDGRRERGSRGRRREDKGRLAGYWVDRGHGGIAGRERRQFECEEKGTQERRG